MRKVVFFTVSIFVLRVLFPLPISAEPLEGSKQLPEKGELPHCAEEFCETDADCNDGICYICDDNSHLCQKSEDYETCKCKRRNRTICDDKCCEKNEECCNKTCYDSTTKGCCDDNETYSLEEEQCCHAEVCGKSQTCCEDGCLEEGENCCPEDKVSTEVHICKDEQCIIEIMDCCPDDPDCEDACESGDDCCTTGKWCDDCGCTGFDECPKEATSCSTCTTEDNETKYIPDGCKDGYVGENCEPRKCPYETEECKDGFKETGDTCQSGGKTYKKCKPDDCQGYGLRNCPSNAECDTCQAGNVTKYKVNKCKTGWKGDDCYEPEECSYKTTSCGEGYHETEETCQSGNRTYVKCEPESCDDFKSSHSPSSIISKCPRNGACSSCRSGDTTYNVLLSCKDGWIGDDCSELDPDWRMK